ncbi:MAG TPA: hypothetical protein VN857_03900 [Chthoniobacterales bacterium]|jgi:hypothetical protein|nr:hypothetical protein [Chthoniobacterales bacterium]
MERAILWEPLAKATNSDAYGIVVDTACQLTELFEAQSSTASAK